MASFCLRLTAYGLLLTAFCFSGCSTDWQRKFIRKKAEKPKEAQFAVESFKSRPYEDLYKEHFNYWKNWHRQLIQDLGSNRKREIQDVREARRHLAGLDKYLVDEKAAEVPVLVERFDELTQPVIDAKLSAINRNLLGRRLEALKLEIERTLHYEKMQDYLLPTPIPVNLEDYVGEEPVLSSLEVKPEASEADSSKDEILQNLTYEKYRALPIS